MKACREIGWRRSLRFLLETFLLLLFKAMIVPPLRTGFLRICGARIGRNTVIHEVAFFNLYRGSFRNLVIGHDCFVGHQTMLDLADRIVLEDQVTLAERVTVLTHFNVGYADHPLQARFPKKQGPVTIKEGSFVGAQATVLPGVTIGPRSLLAAGAVAVKDLPPDEAYAGVPARPLSLPRGVS
jgi:maltose O-acetyltransferase